jgi:dolichol-phosphate mannosyltransferase
MKVFVLLPAYNEEDSIPRLLPKIHSALSSSGHEYQLIITDDGSGDATNRLLKEASQAYPIHLITHSINRGLGETSRDNFEAAAKMSDDGDIIIRLDCDDTHEPYFILDMITRIQDGYDVVIASRFAKGGGQKGVSIYRALISYGANIFMKIFFPIRGVREYSCGYRAYSASIIKHAISTYGNSFIQLRGLGFTCTLEKLVKLHMLGARFVEVPFVLRYDNKNGSSKMIGSITTLGYIIMVILNYWPWGGWRSQRKRNKIDMKRSLMKIGG